LFFHIKNTVAYVPFLQPLHQRWFGYPYAGDYFIARQPMAASRVYFDTVRDSLDRIHQHTQQHWDIPFVAFMPPRHWQYSDREAPNAWEKGGYDVLGPYALESFNYFEAIEPSLGYPLVALLPDFQQTERFPLSFDSDSHWNAAGARFAAERVFAHCLAMGCFAALERQRSSSGVDGP